MQLNKYTHTHKHTQVSLIPPWEDQCEWHRMTRMTRLDCAFFFFFGEIAFSQYFFCIISAFYLYGEYVARSFLPSGVFLLCDHGLDFDISLCENSINQSIIIRVHITTVKVWANDLNWLFYRTPVPSPRPVRSLRPLCGNRIKCFGSAFFLAHTPVR